MESTDLNTLIALIALIESEPFIWRDTPKSEADRDKIWGRIAKQLGISVREAKLTFSQLRQKYWKEKEEKEAQSANQSESGGDQRKEWALFKSLAFLDASIKRRRSSVNYTRTRKMFKMGGGGDYANSETDPESSDNSEEIDLRRHPMDAEALGMHLVKTAIQMNVAEQNTANLAFGKFVGKSLDELGPPFDGQLQAQIMDLINVSRAKKSANNMDNTTTE